LFLLHCCFLRLQLAEEFATASRRYAESVVRLTRLGVTGPDYLRLEQQASEAQNLSEAASAAFEEHVARHRCLDNEQGEPSTANATNRKQNRL
jgi:hypothetical protein